MGGFFQTASAVFRSSSRRIPRFSPGVPISVGDRKATARTPIPMHQQAHQHTRIDRFLLKCNFLIWFVNLAILLPRALN
jgi:hypothetical protein